MWWKVSFFIIIIIFIYICIQNAVAVVVRMITVPKCIALLYNCGSWSWIQLKVGERERERVYRRRLIIMRICWKVYLCIWINLILWASQTLSQVRFLIVGVVVARLNHLFINHFFICICMNWFVVAIFFHSPYFPIIAWGIYFHWNSFGNLYLRKRHTSSIFLFFLMNECRFFFGCHSFVKETIHSSHSSIHSFIFLVDHLFK